MHRANRPQSTFRRAASASGDLRAAGTIDRHDLSIACHWSNRTTAMHRAPYGPAPRLVSAALWCCLATLPASAQDASEAACRAPNVTNEQRIAGCGAIIEGGSASGRSLAIAFCNRAHAFTEKQDFDAAMADLKEAIRIDPRFACSFSNRGRVWAFKGDFERAIADYSIAIKLDPEFAIAYNNRGDAYLKRGEIDRAIADFSAAIKLDPLSVKAYGNRRFAYQRKRDYKRSLADYSTVIQIAPNDVLAFINRGNVW